MRRVNLFTPCPRLGCRLEGLEVGRRYELVVSNLLGLWR